MALSSLSAAPVIIADTTRQLQTLQAQRTADQAENMAQELRRRADGAQRVADQAQEDARSLRVQSDRADGAADLARQSLAGHQTLAHLTERLSGVYDRVVDATAQGNGAAPAVVVTPETAATGNFVDTTA